MTFMTLTTPPSKSPGQQCEPPLYQSVSRTACPDLVSTVALYHGSSSPPSPHHPRLECQTTIASNSVSTRTLVPDVNGSTHLRQPACLTAAAWSWSAPKGTSSNRPAGSNTTSRPYLTTAQTRVPAVSPRSMISHLLLAKCTSFSAFVLEQALTSCSSDSQFVLIPPPKGTQDSNSQCAVDFLFFLAAIASFDCGFLQPAGIAAANNDQNRRSGGHIFHVHSCHSRIRTDALVIETSATFCVSLITACSCRRSGNRRA